MGSGYVRNSITTVFTVWQRTFLDALLSPRRFRKMMPEFRRASDMFHHPGIDSLEVGQFPSHELPVRMLSLHGAYGGMPPQDLYAVLRTAQWLQPRRIFEFGTFQGVTTAHLALNTGAQIYTLDLPREMAGNLRGYTARDLALLQSRQEIGWAYAAGNSIGRIHQLLGDSRSFDYGPYLGSIDLVLVDACHILDYVLSDSQNALQLLGASGAILWHDFGNSQDVMRALRRLAPRYPLFHIEGTALALHCRGLRLPNHRGKDLEIPSTQQVA